MCGKGDKKQEFFRSEKTLDGVPMIAPNSEKSDFSDLNGFSSGNSKDSIK